MANSGARSLSSRLATVVGVGGLLLVACGKHSEAPPASWEPDRSCVSSDECRPVEGCCPAPCASLVINARDMDKMRARVAEQCKTQKREQCPQAGACLTNKIMCLRGQCAVVFEGSPDWPKDGG